MNMCMYSIGMMLTVSLVVTVIISGLLFGVTLYNFIKGVER